MARNPVILLPMGSYEDQGPHAPMGDWMFAERIAARATERDTRTLMAPTLPFGRADYFRSHVGRNRAGPGNVARGDRRYAELPAAPRADPDRRYQRARRQRAGDPRRDTPDLGGAPHSDPQPLSLAHRRFATAPHRRPRARGRSVGPWRRSADLQPSARRRSAPPPTV